jgi:hypothetical protein
MIHHRTETDARQPTRPALNPDLPGRRGMERAGREALADLDQVLGTLRYNPTDAASDRGWSRGHAARRHRDAIAAKSRPVGLPDRPGSL